MKNIKNLRRLYYCLFIALASTASADNAPLWLDQTNTVTAPAGTQVLLRAIADATPPPTYYWLSNSVPIVGATTNSLVVTASASTVAVKWSIVASNSLGSTTNGPYYVVIPTGNQTYYQWGNATLSGTNNSVLDVLKIGDYISGTTPLSGSAFWIADVNQDGLVNSLDQNLVESAILGRTTLTNINSLVVSDSYNGGIPNWLRWQLGLYQDTASTGGTGIPDGDVLAYGDDPLDPRTVPAFGYYSASPPVTIINLTATPTTAGIFVANPPVTIINLTATPTTTGIFVANPPVAIINLTATPTTAGIFVANPPVAITISK